MNAVEKRIAAQLKADVKQCDADLKRATVARDKLVKEGDKLAADFGVAWEKLKTDEQADVSAALTRLTRLTREVGVLNTKIAAENARKATLTGEAEMPRRVELAKKLGVGDEPMSGPEAAEAVLLYHGTPMRVEDITRDMLEAGTVRLNGKTPNQTVSAYLAKAAKKGDKFVRLSPGTFDVKPKKAEKADTKADVETATA